MKRWGSIILIGLLLGAACLWKDSQELPMEKEKLIRFHVLANSDRPEDQALKLKVRDRIMEAMAETMVGVNTVAESREILKQELDHIQALAQEVIQENGQQYPVTVALQNHVFPTRKYGNVILPAGEYEALRVVIGEGEGQNWWCIMFPPLCFIDIKNSLLDEKTRELLKSQLSEEEYQLVYQANHEEELDLQLRSKLWDLIVKSKEQFIRFASIF